MENQIHGTELGYVRQIHVGMASNKARLETDEKNAMIKLIPSNDL
jgi:putative heme iron utilization protein